MGKQTELLDLQAIDSRLGQLRKQRSEIPERVEADDAATQIAKVEAVLARAEEQLHDGERLQARLESEDETISDKIAREEQKLYGGSVVNPKELGAIQEEVASLKKKRDDLETSLLEAMEAVEEGRARVGDIEQRRSTGTQRLTELEAIFSQKAADLDGRITEQEQSRADAVARVSDDILATYEKVREQKGGVAVGELTDDICGACRVELPAQELERMRGSDGIWRCPQCRRILVERG